MGRKANNLTGQQFGEWTVIRRDGRIAANAAWLCQCPSGHQRRIGAQRLQDGRVTRCPDCTKGTLRRLWETDELFVLAWQRASTIEEVAEQLAITAWDCRKLAHRLRVNGVKLKKMNQMYPRRAAAHYERMRQLAEEAIDPKE